jgi:UPF0176 protein
MSKVSNRNSVENHNQEEDKNQDIEQDEILVVALYLFTLLSNRETLQVELYRKAALSGIKGTLLLAKEGINGTISGNQDSIRKFLQFLRDIPALQNFEHKESWTNKQPFRKLKVLMKNEIVNLGVDVDPTNQVGEYVRPSEWNELIEKDDVILIDTRNDYEIGIGTFKNAVDPNTRSFKDFPKWVQENLSPEKHKKVAMFCTGGIRCEKATSFMLELGFENVYHLQGGILKYLEDIAEENSLWEGECFVFDERVSVDHQLKKGPFVLCPHCGNPSEQNNMKSSFHREHCQYFSSSDSK